MKTKEPWTTSLEDITKMYFHSEYNHMLRFSDLYEQTYLLMQMVNILCIAVSGLPDKKALAKLNVQQKKVIKNILKNRLLEEDDKRIAAWWKRYTDDLEKGKVR